MTCDSFPAKRLIENWRCCPRVKRSVNSIKISQLIIGLNVNLESHLSAGLIVVEVHEGLRELGSLPALPAVAGVDEGARERDAEVDVVRAAGPLKKASEFGYCDIIQSGSHINHVALYRVAHLFVP